jgi:hypothetical protein
VSTSSLSPNQITRLSGLVATYICAQRERFAARATALPQDLRVRMNSFFRAELLNTARAGALENERVGDPEFYPMLHELGFRNLPDFQTMAAITVNDIIVSHEPLDARILFH